ncbi:hypothetical protein GF359_06835, partial [candidate division WOR-3 bacterium]|nr:hypothetical protein [candidate division WOR-3 bacterium]MBD3364913.1 hypothetical protein [candidate division WOR-3 bacterium]
MFFRKEKYVIERNALVDGRVISLFEFQVLKGKVYVPSATDNQVSSVTRLEKCPGVKIQYVDDMKTSEEALAFARSKKAVLFKLSKELNAEKLRKEGIRVVDIDALFERFVPHFRPGDETVVRVVKRGKGPAEGVGYFSNGIKVVIEEGA